MQSRIDTLFFQLTAITMILPAYGTVGIITPTFDDNSVLFEFWQKDSTNQLVSTRVKYNNLNAAPFNPKLETKILIHGFQSSPSISELDQAVKRYFSIGSYNIILVDWSVEAAGNGILGYVATHQKTIQLGNLVGKLLTSLKSRGGDYATMHCIGHSLGAHVCNAAAQFVAPDQLARVTNLDPAAVLEFSMRPIRGQARFSDIIHTSYFFGEVRSLADADFYPNGGLNQNCDQTCSHKKVVNYYLDSITSSAYVGRSCASWLLFALGLCNEKSSAIMGENCSPSWHRVRFA